MTYRNRIILTSVLLASLSVAGCGSSAKKGAPANFDEFVSRFYTALCDIQVACGDMPDMATCKASIDVQTTDLLTAKADIASGKVHYDSAKASACLEYAERLYGSGCTRSATAAAAADTTGSKACSETFVGTVADGGACFTSFECTSARCTSADPACTPAHQCCAGTCVAKPTPIAIGADCSASLPDQDCEEGSFCFTTATSTTATCIVPSKVQGTACTSVYECASPMFCDIHPAGTGTCQPAAASGAACNSDVLFGSCDDLRQVCSKATGTCTPRGAAGAACDSAQVLTCLGYTECIGSVCVTLSTARGACNATNGPDCLGGLECSATTSTCGFPANAPACM